MIPIVTIVGKSGSGKTTFIEKLIPELIRRGYRVGTVKHHLHDFEIDQPGKDSWRHARAGATTTIIASPQKVAMIKHATAEMPLEEMRTRFFDDVDVIVAEGYKSVRQPKIEIFRAAVHERPLFAHDAELIAMVTDTPFSIGVPCFGLEDIAPCVDFLVQTLFNAAPCATP